MNKKNRRQRIHDVAKSVHSIVLTNSFCLRRQARTAALGTMTVHLLALRFRSKENEDEMTMIRHHRRNRRKIARSLEGAYYSASRGTSIQDRNVSNDVLMQTLLSTKLLMCLIEDGTVLDFFNPRTDLNITNSK